MTRARGTMGDAAQDLDAKGGALDTAKDLFAGAAGGIAQVLIGMRLLIILSFACHYDKSFGGNAVSLIYHMKYRDKLRTKMSGKLHLRHSFNGNKIPRKKTYCRNKIKAHIALVNPISLNDEVPGFLEQLKPSANIQNCSAKHTHSASFEQFVLFHSVRMRVRVTE